MQEDLPDDHAEVRYFELGDWVGAESSWSGRCETGDIRFQRCSDQVLGTFFGKSKAAPLHAMKHMAENFMLVDFVCNCRPTCCRSACLLQQNRFLG